MQLSVIDLSGLEDEVSDYIAYKILSEIYDWAAGGEFKYPVFVFIEEAHRFIPPEGRTLLKRNYKENFRRGTEVRRILNSYYSASLEDSLPML
jgi:DNA helicase HerA-like ATPase